MNSDSPMSGGTEELQANKIIQLSLVLSPHRNQQLFSDHYLNVILPKREDWQMLAVEAEPVMHELQHILANYMPSDKEAQVEDGLVKPVLRYLRHVFEVQPSLETPDGTKAPDYMFYRDQAALIANRGKKLNEALLRGRAFAVGDAKYWDRPLDVSLKSMGGDPFTNKNPSYQISFYMQHGGLEWGILTNGRLWRLYHKETAHKLDRFYEVNLPELLQTGNVKNFLYFYAFFRRQAFEPGDLGIEAIRLASVDYARGVGDTLKAQVYEALRHVAQGFLDYQPNKLQPDSDRLKIIYDNALIVLYRLLFIFYAEARELLPIRENTSYHESYSLESMKKDIQKNLDAHRFLLPNTATLWAQLRALFSIIDEGSPPLNVATFNGGLFDPERYPFLDQYAVGDQHLQQALDKLARVDGRFVDYRDLAERHLGTIYEGLLEYHLEKVDPPDHGWTIDLKTEKGERRATGSFYTPDYIVKYMVEKALEPALRKAVASATTEQEKVMAVLNVRVLDPAMGSGHFPVEATEHIARFLVENTKQPPTDTGSETELTYWKRRVAQSCIYGVDLNPLAVDLAKLSLWLTTVAKNRPLSFLDHHLRCGNSLIGARLADPWIGTPSTKKGIKRNQPTQDAAVAQPMLFDDESLRQDMTTAVDMMWLIESSPAQTVAEVKEQEQTYGSLRQKLTDKYGALMNLVSAAYFGLTIDPTFWRPLADYATGRNSIAPPQFDTWLQTATALSDEYHFFHWELEFPEVFFDHYGQYKGAAAGFDVVIGNPPYDVLKRDKSRTPLTQFIDYVRRHPKYKSAISGMLNIFQLMIVQDLSLTAPGGVVSQIVPMSLLSDSSTSGVRRLLIEKSRISEIQAFPQKDDENNRVFPEAKFSTAIFVAHTGLQTQTLVCCVHPGKQIDKNSPALEIKIADVRKFDPENLTIPLGNAEAIRILLQLYNQATVVPFGKMLKVSVGEIDMSLDRDCVQALPSSHELVKGAHLQRYLQRIKPKQGQREWISLAAFSHKYVRDSVKAALFQHERVAFQAITGTDDARRLKATLIPSGYFLANSLNFFTLIQQEISHLFVLALFNSSLLEWCFRLTSTNNNVNNYQVEALPFRLIAFNTPSSLRAELLVQAISLYKDEATKLLLDFVEDRLTILPEQCDIIHDLVVYLAEQMLILNKQRQTAMEALITDLEGVLSATDLEKISRLWTPSINILPSIEVQQVLKGLETHRLTLQDDIGFLSEEQWKWLLKKRLGKVTNFSDLVYTYRRHQPVIAHLTKRITTTDQLIDQIVYRLYGLDAEDFTIINHLTSNSDF